MAQHDFVLDNAGGTALRVDLNLVLAAIKSTSSGGTAPSSAVEGQLWWDTTNDVLKLYNGAAWLQHATTGKAIAMAIVFG